MDERVSEHVRICRAALACVQRGDVDAYGELFADEAVMTFPFAPAGFPRVMRGRDEIVATLAPLWRRVAESGRVILGFEHVRWHEVDDDRTVVAEFDMTGRVARTGETYRVSYVHVYRFDDSRIVELRDYWDAAAIALLPA